MKCSTIVRHCRIFANYNLDLFVLAPHLSWAPHDCCSHIVHQHANCSAILEHCGRQEPVVGKEGQLLTWLAGYQM